MDTPIQHVTTFTKQSRSFDINCTYYGRLNRQIDSKSHVPSSKDKIEIYKKCKDNRENKNDSPL